MRDGPLRALACREAFYRRTHKNAPTEQTDKGETGGNGQTTKRRENGPEEERLESVRVPETKMFADSDKRRHLKSVIWKMKGAESNEDPSLYYRQKTRRNSFEAVARPISIIRRSGLTRVAGSKRISAEECSQPVILTGSLSTF
ncbi:hypothetical protein J6590_018083 [Homalodisca vitripennis]|nr:hypothetical protein J6590_099609 [Homalodisca vitripennis]KAG8322703.1 hypothetical protein J6590_018083 [Homalodisca vitripennis]